MTNGPLLATASEFSRHVSTQSRSLAAAAGLDQHQFILVPVEEVAADGDLQVRVQASESATGAINQRGVRENTHRIWENGLIGDSLFFGYSESWHTSGRRRRLGSAAVRFFYKSGLDDVSESPVQLFRFEWADAEPIGGGFGFPAKGAATPHWHYDGLQADRLANQLLIFRDLLERAPDTAAESAPREFDPASEHESDKDQQLSRWFGQIHFPVRANWHEYPLVALDFSTIDPNPHAHSPETILQLENTMCSAVRYLRHQMRECSPA
jgi:hypothetical protein